MTIATFQQLLMQIEPFHHMGGAVKVKVKNYTLEILMETENKIYFEMILAKVTYRSSLQTSMENTFDLNGKQQWDVVQERLRSFLLGTSMEIIDQTCFTMTYLTIT